MGVVAPGEKKSAWRPAVYEELKVRAVGWSKH